MALKKTIKTVYGFDATDAYHKIENVNIVKKAQLQFNVLSYKDAPNKEFVNGVPAFAENIYQCEYIIDKENPIKQAYLYLKTLPEFANAQDC